MREGKSEEERARYSVTIFSPFFLTFISGGCLLVIFSSNLLLPSPQKKECGRERKQRRRKGRKENRQTDRQTGIEKYVQKEQDGQERYIERVKSRNRKRES